MKTTAALLPLLALAGCSYIQNVHLLTTGELVSEEPVVVPFSYPKQLIVVEATVDGVQGKFVLDTGAFDSKISTPLADRARLIAKTTKTVTTAQGIDGQVPVTQVTSFQLASADFQRTSAGILTFADSSATRCLADGLIGANLMRRGYWKIDYQKQTVTISAEPIAIPDRAITLPFQHPTLSATPSVSVNLAGRPVSGVIVDTGFNGGLVLPLELADEFAANIDLTIQDQSTSGIFGSNNETLVVKTLPLAIGDWQTSIPVEFSSLGKGLLGNEVLEHFDIYLDYQQDLIHLVPASPVLVEPTRPFLVAIGEDDQWVVARTTTDSDHQLADTIATINGLKPSDVFTDFCDYVTNIDRLDRLLTSSSK